MLWQCLMCGTVFTGVRETTNMVRGLYDDYYDRARFEIPPAVAVSLDRLVCSFERYRCTGRLLDIGYGEGGLLEIAESRGWGCYGTETSPQALEYGEERGWVVTVDAESDRRFPHQGFDVVTMIELLEHVPKPSQLLRAAAHWLRLGGLLYATTPNAESLNCRFLGSDWSIFSPPEHLTIWTARGLRYALAQTGFEVQRSRTEGFNPCEIIARVRRRTKDRETVDRNQAAFALNTAFSRNALRRALKRGINHCLSAFRMGDSLKAWALRTENTMLER